MSQDIQKVRLNTLKSNNQRQFRAAVCLLVAFVFWTVALRHVDLQAIGPNASVVGFATLNGAFHKLIGVHMSLYILTDWLSLVPFCVVLWFAVQGLFQWITRKSLLKVDHSLLLLGGFYIIVSTNYLFFEQCIINFRPVLICGYLEASYPSSTTMLVMCVMATAGMQANARIKNCIVKRFVTITIAAFTVFMVIARLVSGVHWLTDIIGGLLLSFGLVTGYFAFSRMYPDQ